MIMGRKKRLVNLTIINSWYVTKFSRDIYLPSLPAIATGLAVSNTKVQYAITIYFFGLAVSRFLCAPLSDLYGRRSIILICLPIFILGSLVATFADSIWMFYIGRLFQALGIGCITALSRSMLNDLYDESDATKALTYLSIFAIWAPALATIFGGHIQMWYGWRVEFIVLMIMGLSLFLQAIFYLQETNKQLLSREQVVSSIVTNYKELICNKNYCRYLLCYSFIFSGTVVYYTSSPFLFIHSMHIAPHVYGYFAVVTVSGLL